MAGGPRRRQPIPADKAKETSHLVVIPQAMLTIYRALVRDLMGVIIAHWPNLGDDTGSAVVSPVERLIHPTSKRPKVSYPYFARRYYKFASYLRRAAINAAAGQVRSFMTCYDGWQTGH